MLGVREHYFSERLWNNRQQLPWPFAVALANMTRTRPYFWQKTSYTLEDALGINLTDAPLDDEQKAQFCSRDFGKVRPITLVEKSHRMMQGSQETFTPHEFLRYVLDNAHQGHKCCPISRQVFSLKFSRDPRQLEYDEKDYLPSKRLPKKTINALRQLSNQNDTEFWEKTEFTLADTDKVEFDMKKSFRLLRSDEPAAAPAR